MAVDTQYVRLCPQCKNPMIGTLVFRGCELYCLDCGFACGIFGGASAPQVGTAEQLAKRAQDEANFAPLGLHLSQGQFYLNNCSRCNSRESIHLHHLTDREKAMRIKARKQLQALKREEFRG